MHDHTEDEPLEFTLVHAVVIFPALIAVIAAIAYTVMSAGSEIPAWMPVALCAVMALDFGCLAVLNRCLPRWQRAEQALPS